MNRSAHSEAKEIRRMINRSIRERPPLKNRGMAMGHYWEKINGVLVPQVHENLIVAEGLTSMLKVNWGATAKFSTWYIALWANATDPLSTWTAANFTANAGEITSTSEGFSGANRIAFVPVVPTTPVMNNTGSESQFTIVCTTTLTVTGAAMLSAQARGATTGVLSSAARYAIARTLQNGDTYQVGYQMTFTSS